MLGHAEEEVEGQLGTVVEHHHVAGLVERRDAPAGTNPMSRSANAARSAADVSGDGGTGVENGMTSVISHASRTPRVER